VIDAGDDAACNAAPVDGVDQRGVVRPQGLGCDTGAHKADWAAVSQTIAAFYSLSDSSTGVLQFDLLADDTFVDSAGDVGRWNFTPPAALAFQYDVGFACDGLWHGRFASPMRVSGQIICRDGSGITGFWRGAASS